MSTILGKPMIVEEFGKAYGGNTAESGQGQTQQDQVHTNPSSLILHLLPICGRTKSTHCLEIVQMTCFPSLWIAIGLERKCCEPMSYRAESFWLSHLDVQLDYYKLTYSIVETSIDAASVIKGIAFWRWNALNTPAAALASFDNAATIGEPLSLPYIIKISCKIIMMMLNGN